MTRFVRARSFKQMDDAHPFVDVEIGGRFIEEVHVCIAKDGGADRHALELTPESCDRVRSRMRSMPN